VERGGTFVATDAALPAGDLQRWRPYLELVNMPAGTSMCHRGEHPSHVCFPNTASVSMLPTTSAGDLVEVVAIGSEGVVGIPVITGEKFMLGDASAVAIVAGAHDPHGAIGALQQASFSGAAAVQVLFSAASTVSIGRR